MTQTKNQSLVFSIVFIVVFVLSIFIFLPFLSVLAIAAMMSVVLGPIYRHILKSVNNKESIAALITVVFLLIVVLLPLTLVGGQLISEAQSMYANISTNPDVSVDKVSMSITEAGKKIYAGFNFDAKEYVAFISSWIVNHLGGIFSGTLDLILKFALGLVALFYFLKDGVSFRKHIIEFSPLSDVDDTHILDSLKNAINSIIKGSFIISLIQGVLAGIGFAIFGIPNATLWGTTAAIAALVPGVGTALVWIPAVIYLFFAKAGFAWAGLLIWSAVLVGLIDNFVGPKIFERGVNIHPLLILFSILGGLSFFGPAGFLLGPLVLSLLFALVRVYQHSSKASINNS